MTSRLSMHSSLAICSDRQQDNSCRRVVSAPSSYCPYNIKQFFIHFSAPKNTGYFFLIHFNKRFTCKTFFFLFEIFKFKILQHKNVIDQNILNFRLLYILCNVVTNLLSGSLSGYTYIYRLTCCFLTDLFLFTDVLLAVIHCVDLSQHVQHLPCLLHAGPLQTTTSNTSHCMSYCKVCSQFWLKNLNSLKSICILPWAKLSSLPLFLRLKAQQNHDC